jgi:hypothetical protein
MSKALFKKLWDNFEGIVGPAVSKSKEHLDEILNRQLPNSDHNHQWTNFLFAHEHSTGGFISGEVKVAITLRILEGGLYLDLALLFEPRFNHTHKIFRYVVHNWLVHDSFYPINGVDYCRGKQQMQEVSLQFSRASRGVINGCIGALDGWIVKIHMLQKRDGMGNIASFYSCKGYFGINFQNVVDKQKKILFRSIKLRGAEHNSIAFKLMTLYKWLLINWRQMVSKGLHFRGDSAYSIKSFILTPYDNAAHVLGKTGQTNQITRQTDNSELPEFQQDWVKVCVSRQQGSSRNVRAKLSLLTLYLAIQCHALSTVNQRLLNIKS